MYESAAPISGRLFLFSDSRDVKRLWSAEIHLHFPVAREFYTQLCLATRTSKGARRVTTLKCKNWQAARRVVSTGLAACGWLRGTSRTSPGPPRWWRRPVWLRSTSALAGAASPLTCRAAPVNFSPFAALTTPKGLRSLRSASSLSFLVTCQRQVIPSHSFAALTALVVRRVSGDAALFMYCISGDTDRPMLCACQPPHAPRRGIGVRTRRRHLAARACCAPRKWPCSLIYVPHK